MKHLIYYLISLLILVFSIIGIIYTAIPEEDIYLIDDNYWDDESMLSGNYDFGDTMYVYTNDPSIDYAVLLFNSSINFYNTDRDLQYSLEVNNFTSTDYHVFYNDISAVEEDEWNGYRLIGQINFRDGYHTFDFQDHLHEIDSPILTTREIITVEITDNSEYTIFPILSGFIGLSFFTMTHFSKRRESEYSDSKQDYSKHHSKKERY